MQKKNQLFIVGAGSVGGHIAKNIEAYGYNKEQVIGFLDDDPLKHGKHFCGYEIKGNTELLSECVNPVDVVVGIAFPSVKEKIVTRVMKNGQLQFPAMVHQRAWISKDVQIGQGSIIYPNSSVNYGSSIAEFVVINMNCAVGHDVVIGSFSSLAPGVLIGGNTVVGKVVEMGIGSVTLQGIKIGAGATVGGQAMVTRDVAKQCAVKGVPAKPTIVERF